ncbi:LacI family DNA-binding transcriptional regulator [Cerasicoccus maritimus]|uniref:LacI family DNA-binding transcriptional regulator n=1 Tax=Cerasicoccus maritimus TaxID=490089 RepID=UPI002852632E|nr:LacI family DNA-binding transcriptional regulator [Cerasicoccus maritimus]
MNSRVTLRDIAEVANVHYSSVSLALRDHPRVSAPVREKIKKLAQEMGYVPDPALSALNAYRKTKLPVHYKSTLAWIDTWTGKYELRDQPTFNEYFEGALERARQLGYTLEEFKLRDSKLSPKRLTQVLNSRGIVGILLPPQESPRNRLDLDYTQFSTVTFGYSITPHVFHLVTNHQYHSMSLALEELTRLGYQRIGVYLHDYVDSKTDNAYTSSYWSFQQHHPEHSFLPACIVPDGKSDREALAEWYDQYKPDVILSDTDEPTKEMLADMGLRVPEDIGCAWLSQSGEKDHRAGIDQKGQIIGQTAIDFLVGMLQRGERGIPETPIRMLVEGSWRPGKTIAPQSKPKARRKK